jgi:hypothetical protein
MSFSGVGLGQACFYFMKVREFNLGTERRGREGWEGKEKFVCCWWIV